MLRAARVKFIAITMLILLGVFLTTGAVIFGLIHKNVSVSTDIALKELFAKVKPGELSALDVQRGIIIRTTASGAIDFTYDGTCYDEMEIFDLYTQAMDSGEKSGAIGDTYFRIVENENERIFIAADRSIEKTFESQSATVYFFVLTGSYILLFFIVWGLSYVVFRPIQDAFVKQNQFISDASHELKTPISIISASAEVLSLDQDNEYLSNIKQQTRRMSSLISDLLSLAKLDESKELLENKELNLSVLIGKCVLQFDALAFERGREIVTDFNSNISITGDAASIEKIVTILLDNALKYSEDREIRCTLKKNGEKATFSVYNQAYSVKADTKTKIFERFYRAENSRSRDTGGSGLGLSIAKKIAEINKWKIFATIEENESITMHVVFSE